MQAHMPHEAHICIVFAYVRARVTSRDSVRRTRARCIYITRIHNARMYNVLVSRAVRVLCASTLYIIGHSKTFVVSLCNSYVRCVKCFERNRMRFDQISGWFYNGFDHHRTFKLKGSKCPKTEGKLHF